MAIELGKLFNLQQSSDGSNQILGVGYPFNSDGFGIFSFNTSTLRQKVDNLINVITTQKGERLLNPEFGSRILSLLFEQLTEDYLERIETEIRNTAAQYVPELSVKRVDVQADPTKNLISLSIAVTLAAVRTLTSDQVIVINIIVDDKGNLFTRLTNQDLKYVEG